MTVPFIHWFEEDEAAGPLAEAYRAYREAHPERDRVPDILKCFGHRPDFFRHVAEFSYSLHFSDGHLTRRTKEMVATLVSGLNQCPY